jgi:hypothetical protein
MKLLAFLKFQLCHRGSYTFVGIVNWTEVVQPTEVGSHVLGRDQKAREQDRDS